MNQDQFRNDIRRRRHLTLGVMMALALLGLIVVVLLILSGTAGAAASGMAGGVGAVLRGLRDAPPEWFVLAVAVLPAFAFPVSPMLVLSGPAFGTVGGIALSSLGLALNLVLCYGVARQFRVAVRKGLTRLGYRMPQVPEGQQVRVTLLFRVIGLPLVIQNYLLGSAGIGFWTYFSVSWPLLVLQTVGYVMLGDALTEGSLGLILLALGLLIALALIIRYARVLLRSREPAAADAAGPGAAASAERLAVDAGDPRSP